MIKFSKITINSIFLIFILLFFIGCAGQYKTTPNVPCTGKTTSALFSILLKQNFRLVEELGKLPDLQDGISEPEKQALKNLDDIYNTHENAFQIAFNHMYAIGIAGNRKYCTPLEAFFWLIINGKSDIAKNILKNYSLTGLLDVAWQYKNPRVFTKKKH